MRRDGVALNQNRWKWTYFAMEKDILMVGYERRATFARDRQNM